ncbi:dihydroorotase [Iodidimonas gelatinilytica]|uniref:Dihydroorotase n=3 Tax=Iodidimonas gelatinilytica TaxID=1236966 RepID=A0A5A7MX88_9PROT|nr:dihydroorotase [Iodidimonas gelatinilytica]GEQ99963.1 dihydroorotase [Iodidimonas gelatinilytica]
MSQTVDLCIRNATLVSHNGIGKADVAVRDGRIVAIGDLKGTLAAQDMDATGLHLLPGVIDTQVHFREPGNEHKEDLESGSIAAVMGGVTAVFEMPNTKPSTSTAEALADKVSRARDRMFCDFAFYVGATGDNAAALAALEQEEGCCGVKVFMGSSTGDLLVSDDAALLRVLQSGCRRVAIHAEDEERLNVRKSVCRAGDPSSHPDWRDVQTALLATKRIVGLARRAGRRIHVLHVTTAEEMAFLAENKDIASIEATPQHLTLAGEDCYKQLGTYAQMNPPIREARHRDALWAAVADGRVDVIGSDHAPHTREEKAKAYPASPSGMPGVQTLLPLLLTHAAQGRLSLERLVDLTSHGANRLFNLRDKGRLAVGFDGDFTLVDLKKSWTVEETWLAARCGWSPFTGMQMTGKPKATIVRGRIVMREDELVGTAGGRPVRFQETIRPQDDEALMKRA